MDTKNFIESILKAPKQKVLNGIPLNVFDFDELEVARQLTLIEYEYYEKILVRGRVFDTHTNLCSRWNYLDNLGQKKRHSTEAPMYCP